MTAAPPTRDIQTVAVADDTWAIRSRSFGRLKFEVEYARQRGTTSNAFLIQGERLALLWPPGEVFTDGFLAEVERLTPFERLDDIVLGHINPNRFRTLVRLLELAPRARVVCSNPGALALRALFEAEGKAPPEIAIVRGQEVLDLGNRHRLQCIPVPTPRWPDGLALFDERTKILYSDKFLGVHVCGEAVYDDGGSDDLDDERHYYESLMASQARQVETALDRLSEWRPRLIAPVHGPMLRQGGLDRLARHRQWNRAQLTATLTVALFYASAYGSTATLAAAIARGITKAGVACETVNCEFATPDEIREVLSRAAGFIIGSPTIGGHAPTPIQTALGIILASANTSQPAAVFGSFGWSGEAIDLLVEKLTSAGYQFAFEPIRVRFKPTEATLQQCEEAGTDFAQALRKARRVKPPVPQAASPVEQAVGRIVGSLGVVTVRRGDASSAMLASWISQASFNPPGLTVAVARDRAIESLLFPGDHFVLNLLEEGRHLALMKHFLRPFGPGEDRFAGIETREAANGSPILTEALAYLECRVASRMEAGDHWLVYCIAEAGNVFNLQGRTAVHFRTTGSHY